MPNDNPISRRDVVLGAGAAALAVSTTATRAGEKDSPEHDARRRERLLHLTITLSDGNTIELDARELTVDFGSSAKIKLQPDGFLAIPDPGAPDGSPQSQSATQES